MVGTNVSRRLICVDVTEEEVVVEVPTVVIETNMIHCFQNQTLILGYLLLNISILVYIFFLLLNSQFLVFGLFDVCRTMLLLLLLLLVM